MKFWEPILHRLTTTLGLSSLEDVEIGTVRNPWDSLMRLLQGVFNSALSSFSDPVGSIRPPFFRIYYRLRDAVFTRLAVVQRIASAGFISTCESAILAPCF